MENNVKIFKTNINEIDIIKKWYIKRENIINRKITNYYKFNNKWNYYNNNDIISNSSDIILIWKWGFDIRCIDKKKNLKIV